MNEPVADAKPAGRNLRRISIKHPTTGDIVSFDVLESLDFKPLTDEEWRVFTFPGGHTVRVDSPAFVAFKPASPGVIGGGSQRIITLGGTVTYVPEGWLSLQWKCRKGYPTVAF